MKPLFSPPRATALCAAVLLLVCWSSLAALDDPPAPTVSPDLPADVTIPDGFMDNPIAFFDDFSWRSFIALNWPAKEGKRGIADVDKAFGADKVVVVWDTWKADFELFQPNGQRPSEWDSFATVSPCRDLPVDRAGATKVIGDLDSGDALSIIHYNQAGFGLPKGSLAAQNRIYVRYEIRVNREEFNFIRGADASPKSWLYRRENLPTGQKPALIFPAGAIEIKAAWREFRLPDEQALLKRYYVREAMVSNPKDGSCRKATIGLVGLHIVHRTPTRREWVWSTFEHIDNLLDAPAEITPTFTDRNGPQTGPTINALLPVVDKDHPPQPNPNPVQVVRLKPIHPSTKKTNDQYRQHPKVKDTVWANYQLVMTQWPTKPAKDDAEFQSRLAQNYPVGGGSPFPDDSKPEGTAVSNATMETTNLFQRQFSCMRCHFMHNPLPEKTEFVWFLRLRAFPSADDSARSLRKQIDSQALEMLKGAEKP